VVHNPFVGAPLLLNGVFHFTATEQYWHHLSRLYRWRFFRQLQAGLPMNITNVTREKQEAHKRWDGKALNFVHAEI
jgi:hypothetical protein